MDKLFSEYEIAKEIATKAHFGQKDKVGADYILHPLAVSENCSSQKAKITALLHDVVEDTLITLDDLKNAGIDKDCLEAIDCLTKRKGESLDDYLTRVASNDIAIEVKFCDMLHNADFTRFPKSYDKDESQNLVFRYASRMIMLINKVGVKTRLLSLNVYDAIQSKINMYLVRSGQLESSYKPPLEDVWFRFVDVSEGGIYSLYIFMFDRSTKLIGYYNVWFDDMIGSLQYVNLRLIFNKDIATSESVSNYVNTDSMSAIERIEKHLEKLKINPDRLYIATRESKTEPILNKRFG